MPGPIASLIVSLGLDAREFQQGITGVSGDMQRIGGHLQDVGLNMTRFVTLPILGAGAAAVKLAMDAEETEARLTSAFESMGAASWTSLEQLRSKAEELMSRTTFDDDAVKDAQAVMLTFGNVAGDSFDRGVESALDLSSALGTDLQSSVIQIGKALNDPIKGVSALTRVGVSFTQQQKDQIKTLTESGRTLEAQNIILAELERQFGGTAEKMAGTAKGQMKQALNALGEAGEEIGALLLPIIGEVAGHIKNLANFFRDLSPEVRHAVVTFAGLAAAVGPVLLITGKLLTVFAGPVGLVVRLGMAAAGFLGLTGATAANTVTTGANTVAQGANNASLLAKVSALAAAKGGWLGLGAAMAPVAVGAAAVGAAVVGINEGLNISAEKARAATDAFKAMSPAQREAAANTEFFGMKLGDIANHFANLTRLVAPWHDIAPASRETADALNDVALTLPTVGEEFGYLTRNIDDFGHKAAEIPPTIARAIGDGSQLVEHNVQVLLDQAAQAAGLRAFRQLGANVPGEVGRGMQSAANVLMDGAEALRDILENGTSPRSRAMMAIGAEYIQLVRDGMDSKKDGAKQTAQEVAIQAINTIEDAGLTGTKGQRGLRAIGIYFDELLASGMTGQGALAALNEAGVDVSGKALSGIRSKYPQFLTTGVGAANKTISGFTAPSWFDLGVKVTRGVIGGMTHEMRNSKGKVIGSLAPIMKLFKGHSPPPEGPFKDFDKDGANLAGVWRTNFLAGLDLDLSGPLRRIGSQLAQPFASPRLTPVPVTGGALLGGGGGGAGGPVVHIHVGALIANDAGIDELQRRMAGRLRQTTRGAGRLVGQF